MKITFLFAFLFSFNTFAANLCDSVLRDGVFNSITRNEEDTHNENNEELFCSKDFSDYARKNKDKLDFGLTVNGTPIKFGFGSDFETSMSQLNESCRSVSSNISKASYLRYAKNEASKEILGAWNKCIDTIYGGSGSKLVSFKYTENEDIITLSAKFNGATGLHPPIIKKLITVGDVECGENTFTEGQEVPYESIRDYCLRSGNGAATIILQTTLGDYQIEIPKKEVPLLEVGSYSVVEEVLDNREVFEEKGEKELAINASNNCWGGSRGRCAFAVQYQDLVFPVDKKFKNASIKCVSKISHDGPCGTVNFQVASELGNKIVIKTNNRSPNPSQYFKVVISYDIYKNESFVSRRINVEDSKIYKDQEFYITDNTGPRRRIKVSGWIKGYDSFSFYPKDDVQSLASNGLDFIRKAGSRYYLKSM